MADNDDVRNSAGTPFTAATDELSDGAKSPKVTIMAGDSGPTPYRIDQAFGALTETAPATDTASSGLNGRLQRIAQRLTTALTGIVLAAGTNLIGKVDHSSTGIGHGVTTVTTAGTDVVLAGSTAAKWVTIQSQTDNTGWIAVGATGVDATEATGSGVLLDAGESITMPIDNLADVFIDSTVNGEGVRYTYGT